MARVAAGLGEKWTAAREKRKRKRRERALKHVEARADRDRYSVQAREGAGGGQDGGAS